MRKVNWKDKQLGKTNKATDHPTPGSRHQMNCKQRRETIRKIQGEDLTLEVVHPDAAGIDIGKESHYVAVPPKRDPQPVGASGARPPSSKRWLMGLI